MRFKEGVESSRQAHKGAKVSHKHRDAASNSKEDTCSWPGVAEHQQQGEKKKVTRKEKRRSAQLGIGLATVSVPRKYRVDATQRLTSYLKKDNDLRRFSFLPAIAYAHYLSRMAYDASRSGTREQLDAVINLATSELQAQAEQTVAIREAVNAPSAIDSFAELATSMFYFALSGVSDTPGLLEHLLVLAAKSLHILLAADELSEHSADIAQKLVTGLSEISVSGILPSQLASTGLCNHIRDLFSALRWPDSLPAHNAAKGASSADIILKATPAVMEQLYRQLFSNAADSSLSFWMHSSTGAPLSALWAHSVKQKKVRSAASAESVNKSGQAIGIKLAKLSKSVIGEVVWQGDSPLGFADMTAPLVVDVGCGFGVTLLGLAASRYVFKDTNDNSFYSKSLPSGDINYLGCDLSNHCVAYAASIARQWKIDSKCRFCVAPAESFLEWVLHRYPGPVVFICIQFPTPYKLDESVLSSLKNSGTRTDASESDARLKKQNAVVGGLKRRNVQLPGINDDNGFMITPELIRMAVDIASRNGASIFIQSNVEDVAVFSRHLFFPYEQITAESDDELASGKLVALQYYDVIAQTNTIKKKSKHTSSTDSRTKAKKSNQYNSGDSSRKLIWAAMGGEAAEGEGWLDASPLPLSGRTETEAVYGTSEKPVYRFAWTAIKNSC